MNTTREKDIPKKRRKAYAEIKKALQNDSYRIIIMVGLRKVGKTVLLEQLEDEFLGHYVDFRNEKNTEEAYEAAFEQGKELLLFDEIGYLKDFDLYIDTIEAAIGRTGKKVVMTGSSYGALKQLSSERLGGGRAHMVELFPLSFEEYLYFSGKIAGYGENYEPAEQDIQDFYRLKNLPPGMEFVIDRKYMVDTFTDIEVARANQCYAQRNVYLTEPQYSGVIDVIAYTLNEPFGPGKFGGVRLGAQEFEKTKGIPMSGTLIGLANKITGKMAQQIVGDIGVQDLAHIMRYLYHCGFLFADLKANENERQISDRIMHELGLVRTLAEFEQVLGKYVFSVISPLIYTRLMVDLENVVGKLSGECTGLYGKLYELTVKSEAIYKKGYDIYHSSHKYSLDPIEVDLWEKALLLEATIRHKNSREHNVDKILVDYDLVRVLTDEPGKYEFNGVYHRIGYPKALLMLSEGSIFKLESRKII